MTGSDADKTNEALDTFAKLCSGILRTFFVYVLCTHHFIFQNVFFLFVLTFCIPLHYPIRYGEWVEPYLPSNPYS